MRIAHDHTEHVEGCYRCETSNDEARDAQAETDRDCDWLREAVYAARDDEAYLGRAPFGCLIVDPDGRILGRGTGTGTDTDPTAHSEMVAIRRAAENRRGLLFGCTLYSTHEPCAMCCGAITHSKVSRVVYGTSRCDHPDYFRQRHHSAHQLLTDTTNPPEIVTYAEGAVLDFCRKLFEESAWRPH